MSTTTTNRLSPPARRAPTPSTTLSANPTPIARGATARSALSPRVTSSLSSTATRRASLKPPTSPLPDSKESLSASLKLETDHKEQLLLQLQDKEQTIATLGAENDTLTSALNAAESRLNELYAEQSRSEVELAQRIDIIDKLRAQVRELEREKRDLQRRYNEQTTSFEAERQAFYDNEQHLKSRIQSLTQARKQPEPEFITRMNDSHAEPAGDEALSSPQPEEDGAGKTNIELNPYQSPQNKAQDLHDPESEPAEMTALRLELSTLSTSYASLQSTLVLLQTQLVDLKRVNREVQEENESYMILLREKTLSGQFDLLRQVGANTSESEDDDSEHADVGSLCSTGRSTLDKVDELPESLELELEHSLASDELNATPSSQSVRSAGRHSRNRTTSSTHAPGILRGETLADLPITGPGLDLAAELGRAENKDVLSGAPLEEPDRHGHPGKKRSKKSSDSRKVSTSSELDPMNDIDALRTEVKSLKDANKALSLYASKIIDRIIAQEGFEHVLAVDYEKDPTTPVNAAPRASPMKAATSTANPPIKARPQSVFISQSTSNSTNVGPPSHSSTPSSAQAATKAQRRSMSFDWKGFSFFSGGSEKKLEPNLRPLTLTPGATTVTGARKLDTYEDEEDRKERERLNATMKLMGIQPPTPVPFPIERTPSTTSATTNTVPASSRRFSLFGRSTSTNSGSSSPNPSTPGESTRAGLGLGVTSNLTQEALEQAEAQNTLAALDAHERNLSVELARGGGGGFTEITPRSIGRRSRRSGGGSGSGSTVWSAGMSANDE
ncbi:hypothetical protein AMATHDRAFT_72350 [Amanita thiersii Skay4041]|uniref:Uncharacterized protein n=1 Tax=Amanita thiersii Skay4041 TaxID=703135 RepID=A0A2A9NWM9_9AGAR|nr:hypothetical protein AMATHDRAFT_72350 [Amanita thiersii Skay4041]